MARTRIDIVDETFIRARPALLRGLFDDPRRLRRLWPHVELELLRDRGPKGVRWQCRGAIDGELEVWIEPYWDGAIVHHYVRGFSGAGAPASTARRHRLRWKRAVHGLKDSLEGRSL